MPFLLIAALAAVPESAQVDRRDECQYLTVHFDTDGFATNRELRDGDFDGIGNAFAADALPEGRRLVVRSAAFGRVEFVRPPTDGTRNNMIACKGQEIGVRTKRSFNVALWLGAAHHGSPSDWIEFEFEDGTTALGPFGFSDWWDEPLLGEEAAFVLPIAGTVRPASGDGFRLWLQRTPIPPGKHLSRIRLPNLPNAKIMALTLAWRDGVQVIEPPKKTELEPGLVAIFGESCFPFFHSRADLSPERIRAAFRRRGIAAAILDLEHLKDSSILNPESYPLFVQPYGVAFPADAEDTIRAYRKAGGCMVHLGVPFCHPVVRSSYGGWIDLGHTGDCLRHQGNRGMGTGDFINGSWNRLVPESTLFAWSLGDVRWSSLYPQGEDRYPNESTCAQPLDRRSLDPTDEVIPLISLEGLEGFPFAAIIRHGSCAFAGCIDLWGGNICTGFEPLDVPVRVALEFIVRGGAWILREKGHIGEAQWRALAGPVPPELREPERLEPVLPDPEWGWRLPKGPAIGDAVLWADLRRFPDAERVLFASAQGLINRRGESDAVYIVYAKADEEALRRFGEKGVVRSVRETDVEGILTRVGHRRAVVVDPGVQGSLNVATMIASVKDLLVAYPAALARHRLEAVEDLRGRFRSASEAYEWARQNLWPEMSRRCLAIADPHPRSYHLRDYLIAHRVFTFWVSNVREQAAPGACRIQESAFASRLLAETPVCIPVLGVDGGGKWVEYVSRFGKYLVVAEGLRNLSFGSAVRSEAEAVPRPTIRPLTLDEGKIYVACLRPFDLASADAAGEEASAPGVAAGEAGTTRLIPPEMADLCPVLLARSRASMKAGGCLGSTGLGRVRMEAFGSVFGEGADRVRHLYFERVDRSMRDLGQRFLVLPDWQTWEDVASWARGVSTAEGIFPVYRAGAGPSARDACYMLDGRPVLHTLLSTGLSDLGEGESAKSPYAGIRPAFTWTLAGPRSESSPDADIVLVNPLELVGLLKQHRSQVPDIRK
ncbi:MAG: hypothetical protein JXP34_12015 [Planctomycetes bacterium]|nr:hypothetical protein [Planctomycetota bacterium]